MKPPPSGLCGHCRWARRLSGARSQFLRCDRSDADPRFARYPSLPVLACPGFEPCPEPAARSPVVG